ncbi:MAG: FtsW/RodA/SpoVE family cell cycle protein [Clostridia bacterium]|nr:FtsW/RodA/SpoVE family cell cycle protein [Clostridia bacterium]
MSLVLVPGIGVRRNDALRWIRLAGIQFQPSEIMKICFILLIAYMICKKGPELKKFWAGLVPVLFTFIPVLGFLYVQDHLSAMMITAVVLIIMLFIGGAKILHLLLVTGGGIAAAGLYVFSTDFRRRRMLIFMDPWQDSLGSGWQIIQSLYAISSGGLFGSGLGQGIQKYMYISEPQNDFILATWAEEMGLIGVLLIVVLFSIFIWRGVRIATKAQDLHGALLAIGITSMVGIQAVFNIAVVSSSMPVTGISLPFCSYGGTSVLVLLMAVGILLSVSRFSKKPEKEE